MPLALSAFLPRGAASPALLLAGAACSAVPDLDVVGFGLGVGYGDVLGHRGLTHSAAFAAALGALLTFALFRGGRGGGWPAFLFLFLSTLSHPLLDMLTNGGLGVALFAPFSGERYFFPWRPIEVSPIGVSSFLSDWGVRVILSELRWVWLPSAVVYGLGVRRAPLVVRPATSPAGKTAPPTGWRSCGRSVTSRAGRESPPSDGLPSRRLFPA